MIAIITVLCALPLGFLLASRTVALATYSVAYLWAYVFQTLYLLLASLDPAASNPAFSTSGFPLDYGLVTLGVFLVGLGLVCLGHWARTRRGVRRTQPAAVSSR